MSEPVVETLEERLSFYEGVLENLDEDSEEAAEVQGYIDGIKAQLPAEDVEDEENADFFDALAELELAGSPVVEPAPEGEASSVVEPAPAPEEGDAEAGDGN